MTTEELKLCEALIVTPPQGERAISKEDFMRRFPSALEDGKLAMPILQEAAESRNAKQLQCALTIGHTFGFSPAQVAILVRVLGDDWHYSHEDVVDALNDLASVSAVSALFDATQRIPTYLQYDDSRALAVKAIWALGRTPGSEAELALRTLASSENVLLREGAQRQLQRRKAQGASGAET